MRPKKEPRESFGSTLRKDLMEKLRDKSIETGIPISKLLDHAVEALFAMNGWSDEFVAYAKGSAAIVDLDEEGTSRTPNRKIAEQGASRDQVRNPKPPRDILAEGTNWEVDLTDSIIDKSKK